MCLVPKAEEIRSRRDYNAWLSRVASGLDMPIQDPISLLGDCMEGRRHLQEENDKRAQQLSRGNHRVPPAAARLPGDSGYDRCRVQECLLWYSLRYYLLKCPPPPPYPPARGLSFRAKLISSRTRSSHHHAFLHVGGHRLLSLLFFFFSLLSAVL